MTDRDPQFDFEAIVAGAGAVGLAAAKALSVPLSPVLVVERHPGIGWETSSRNSEVIHAGLYYAQGSLKARACVAGKHWLYAYCRDRGIPHKNVQKLIVASDEAEIPALEAIVTKARANGVDDLVMMEGHEAQALEPRLACAAALLSPSTGILDSHALMLSYQGDLENAGGLIAFNTAITVIHPRDGGGFDVATRNSSGVEASVSARRVVNAGGLGAQAVAHATQGYDRDLIPRQYLSRGCYFSLTGKAPFERLVYPAPRPESLGVHFSRDLGGRSKFGPDHQWIDEIGYDVDPARADSFYAAIRRYFPALPDGALQADYAGVRPKLQAPGEPPADFRVDGPELHGIPGLVHLFGIESPGLTSSYALAELVVAKLGLGEAPF